MGDNSTTLHNTRDRENPRYTKPKEVGSNLDLLALDTHIHLGQGY